MKPQRSISDPWRSDTGIFHVVCTLILVFTPLNFMTKDTSIQSPRCLMYFMCVWAGLRMCIQTFSSQIISHLVPSPHTQTNNLASLFSFLLKQLRFEVSRLYRGHKEVGTNFVQVKQHFFYKQSKSTTDDIFQKIIITLNPKS